MAAALARRWEWSDDEAGYDSLVALASGHVLAVSPNSGVAALRVLETEAELAWRFPDPAGESLDLVAALGWPGRAHVFAAFHQDWATPTVQARSVRDRALYWQHDPGQGAIYSIAADDLFVFLHHGSRTGHTLRVLQAATGGEVHSLTVPATLTPLVTLPGGDGRVVYGADTAVVEYDATLATSRMLATGVFRPAGGQQLGSVTAAASRVYATDGQASIVAIDRAVGNVLWRQRWPGQPDPGEPVYDAGLNAILVGGLSGELFCLDAHDGAIRWVSRCKGSSGSQAAGVPAVVRGSAGAFVVFPGVDETLYLADARTGQIMDGVPFAWPLEVTLHARGAEVLVPHALGVSAFALRA